MLLQLKLACDSQLFCLWAIQPSPTAASPSPAATATATSANNNSIRAEWLRQSGRALSEPSETPRWQITLCLAPIPHITLCIAHRSQFRHFFPLFDILLYPNTVALWLTVTITTRHFVYHVCFCYSPKIRYLIIWHELFNYLYIYTYGQSGHRW